jgi:hypothetical protein
VRVGLGRHRELEVVALQEPVWGVLGGGVDEVLVEDPRAAHTRGVIIVALALCHVVHRAWGPIMRLSEVVRGLRLVLLLLYRV